MNRTIFHVAFVGLVVVPGVALAQERAAGTAAEVRSTVGGALPPIRSAGDGAFGKPPVRAMSLDEVVKEIGKLDAAGSWRLNKQWEVIINSLVSPEIPRVLEAVEKMRVPGPQEQLRNAIFSRWGETDPAAAMARALAIQVDEPRATARRAVLQGWIYANPKEVLLWAGELAEGAFKNEVATMAAAYALTNDPTAVVTVRQNSGGSTATVGISFGEKPGDRATPAAPAMTEAEAREAIAAAAKLSVEFARVQAYSAVGMKWAGHAPIEALKWALSLPSENERGTVSTNVAITWARREPAEANKYLATLPASDRRNMLIHDTFPLWADRDFEGAVAWARGIADADVRGRILSRVIEKWTQRDPEAVAYHALALPAGYPFISATEQLVAAWAKPNPTALGKFVRAMTPEQRNSQAFLYAVSNWLQSDPAGALPLILEVCKGQQRVDFATRALVVLAKRDVAAAKQIVEAQRESPERNQLVRATLSSVVIENPEFALWLFAKLPPGSMQAEGMANITPALARSNTAKALAWAKQLAPSSARTTAIQVVLRRLTEEEPLKALREALDLPPGQARTATISDVCGRFAQSDPQGAVQAVAAIEDLGLRIGAIRTLVQILSRSDAATAIQVVMSLPVSETRGGLVSQVLQNWAESDVTGALKWAESQATPALQGVAIGAVIQTIVINAPAEAAALLEKMPTGDRLEQAATRVCDAWGRNDPPAAARWAAALPPGNVRMLVLSRVVVPLMRADFVAATAWLENLPAGADRDRAIQAFLLVATADRASELTGWVAKIGDLERRLSAIETIARQWIRTDVEAANRWLAETEMPAERRNRIRASSGGDYFR